MVYLFQNGRKTPKEKLDFFKLDAFHSVGGFPAEVYSFLESNLINTDIATIFFGTDS
jgi:hypothetical protein